MPAIQCSTGNLLMLHNLGWLQTIALMFIILQMSSGLINENQLMSTVQTPADFIISLPLIQMGCLPFSTADSVVIQVLCMTDAMETPKKYKHYLCFPAKR